LNWIDLTPERDRWRPLVTKYFSVLIICCSLVSEVDTASELFLGVKHNETNGKAKYALFTSA